MGNDERLAEATALDGMRETWLEKIKTDLEGKLRMRLSLIQSAQHQEDQKNQEMVPPEIQSVDHLENTRSDLGSSKKPDQGREPAAKGDEDSLVYEVVEGNARKGSMQPTLETESNSSTKSRTIQSNHPAVTNKGSSNYQPPSQPLSQEDVC